MRTIQEKFNIVAMISLAAYVVIFLLLSHWSHFRHDDWVLLGNSITALTERPDLLINGKLFFLGVEGNWFFRPIVLILVYLQFHTFGFEYSYWVFTYVAMMAVSAWLGMRAIRTLGGSAYQAAAFLVFFLCSLQFHLGSVLWVGEGSINCSQVLFLMLSFFFFSVALSRTARVVAPVVGGVLAYCLGLGCKESSIFLVPLLFSVILATKRLHRGFALLTPWILVTIVYLLFRFFVLPMNSGYAPVFEAQYFLKPIGFLFLTLGFPVFVAAVLIPGFFKKIDLSTLSFLATLGLSVVPYLGHPFFSPGWLLLPGLVLSVGIVYCFSLQNLTAKKCAAVASVLFTLSLLILSYRMTSAGWWQWGEAQKTVYTELKALAPDTQRIVIHQCPNENFPNTGFERVVGGPHALYEYWRVVHRSGVNVQLRGCLKPGEPQSVSSKEAHFEWVFPVFKRVEASS